MSQKYRAQILLEPEQHQALQQIARREGRSLSDVAREVIQAGLDARQSDSEETWNRRRQAMQKLRQIREAVQQVHGIYEGNLIAEVRAIREEQAEEVWNQEPEE
jgi:predicted DNA-binding protein